MKQFRVAAAVFLITFSTVVIEILYTRVFSVIYSGSFAFLMISLALFGYGLSGVYLAISRIAKSDKAMLWLERYLFLFAVTIPVIYRLTLLAVYDMDKLFNPASNFLLLCLNFMLLLIHFFLAGTSLVLVFSLFSAQIGRFYFIDLVGAALGALAVIPLITKVEPAGTMILLSILLLCGWLFLSAARPKVKYSIFSACMLVFVILLVNSNAWFPVISKTIKRAYMGHYYNNTIEYSKWSPMSKIDVAPFVLRPQKVLFIDGGTMETMLNEFDGDLKSLGKLEFNPQALPYQMAAPGSALVIGSAGGYEVLCALSHGFRNIIAIEMEPEICNVVENVYKDYIGGIFQRPEVTLINDEGRSVIKRLNQKFDVIQMVNSHSIDFLLSGGLSISESYIYTVEAFKDYWQRLKPNGYVYIVHWFGERMFTTALQALKELGVENPQEKLAVIQKVNPNNPDEYGFNYLFLKNGAITPREFRVIQEFADDHEIVYSPFEKKDNIFYDLVYGDFAATIRNSSVNLAPTYDRSPYFNTPNYIGQLSFKNNLVGGMAHEIVPWALIHSNSFYLSVLGLSVFFSLVLIYLPLKRRSGKTGRPLLISYFFLIGMAFIMVEIILIKIFQLFLGSPAYSISAIIFSMLLSSGLGSLSSNALQNRFGRKTILGAGIFLFVLLIIFAFFLFQSILSLIHFSLFLRLLLTFLIIFLAGYIMGIFFPIGIKFLGELDDRLIGWAWGANSFATVLGSVLTVIMAINLDFTSVLLFAAVFYLAAGIILWQQQKKPLAS